MTEDEMQSIQPIWQQEALILHSQRLIFSFEHWTGKSLPPKTNLPQAQALFEAPFVVVSHGLEADPILNYGNLDALKLWQMDWAQFTATPSRYTAEPIAREERDRLLAQTHAHGFSNNYKGIRITSTGKRFYIQNAIVWNVIDAEGNKWGQAAAFSDWEFLL